MRHRELFDQSYKQREAQIPADSTSVHFYPGGYGDSTERTPEHPLGLPELEGREYKAHVSDDGPR
jgi:hypothetical protein